MWRTTQDYNRYANLIKDRSVTQQQFEQAQAAKRNSRKATGDFAATKIQASRQANAVSSQSNATSTQIGVVSATIKQRQVDVDDAKLNLSYAVVTAPQMVLFQSKCAGRPVSANRPGNVPAFTG